MRTSLTYRQDRARVGEGLVAPAALGIQHLVNVAPSDQQALSRTGRQESNAIPIPGTPRTSSATKLPFANDRKASGFDPSRI
jgi:hypothetical protein